MGSEAPLWLQLGAMLVTLSLGSAAVVLEKIEHHQNTQLTCAQGLSPCKTRDVVIPDPRSGPVAVKRLEPKALLCCKAGRDCLPCLQIKIYLNFTEFTNNQNQSGDDDDDDDDGDDDEGLDFGGGSGLRASPTLTAASIDICYSDPNVIPVCKKLEFTLPSTVVDDHNQPEMWLSLVVSEKLSFDSRVTVDVFDSKALKTIEVPSKQDVCSPVPQRDVVGCDVPMLQTVIDRKRGVAILQINQAERNHSLGIGLCLMYGPGECLYQTLNDTRLNIPLSSVTPCLCIQVWWIKENPLRLETCPFVNHTEFYKNLWDNVSMSVIPTQTNDHKAALSWDLSAPCIVEAELWLCVMEETWAGRVCREVNGSRIHHVDKQKTGEFSDFIPHPSLCVEVIIKGKDGKLGPLCPFTTDQRHWRLIILISVALVCLAVFGSYLLQGSLKRWAWRWFRDDDIREAMGGGQVVLLYPPDPDHTLPGLVCRLGSTLTALGFSVSVDLWSQGELKALGPVPWLHSRLDQLQRCGGKVVLVLTHAAWEHTEKWGLGHPQKESCSPYADVFSASLSCVLADYLQGRAGERFVLARFESLPPLPLSVGRPLPELFRGLPLFSLPSQSLGFLTEIAGARGGQGGRSRQAGGLRAGSRMLAIGLRSTGVTEASRLSGISQDSAGSGLGEAWETVPLQPCHIPRKGIGWV